MYKPPATSGQLEPSLAWKPVLETKNNSNRDDTTSTLALELSKRDPKLHFSSIDPFAYHHLVAGEKKVVSFEGGPAKLIPIATPTGSPNSSPLTIRRDTQVPRERRGSGDNASPSRGCFICGSNHFARDCPHRSPSPNSGNERAPSPNRR
jgi:hypothetical protein